MSWTIPLCRNGIKKAISSLSEYHTGYRTSPDQLTEFGDWACVGGAWAVNELYWADTNVLGTRFYPAEANRTHNGLFSLGLLLGLGKNEWGEYRIGAGWCTYVYYAPNHNNAIEYSIRHITGSQTEYHHHGTVSDQYLVGGSYNDDDNGQFHWQGVYRTYATNQAPNVVISSLH